MTPPWLPCYITNLQGSLGCYFPSDENKSTNLIEFACIASVSQVPNLAPERSSCLFLRHGRRRRRIRHRHRQRCPNFRSRRERANERERRHAYNSWRLPRLQPRKQQHSCRAVRVGGREERPMDSEPRLRDISSENSRFERSIANLERVLTSNSTSVRAVPCSARDRKAGRFPSFLLCLPSCKPSEGFVRTELSRTIPRLLLPLHATPPPMPTPPPQEGIGRMELQQTGGAGGAAGPFPLPPPSSVPSLSACWQCYLKSLLAASSLLFPQVFIFCPPSRHCCVRNGKEPTEDHISPTNWADRAVLLPTLLTLLPSFLPCRFPFARQTFSGGNGFALGPGVGQFAARTIFHAETRASACACAKCVIMAKLRICHIRLIV